MVKQELQHEEIWDDSALVNSWNDALDEYKKYHSLAAKGEKVIIALDSVIEDAPQDTTVEVAEDEDLKQPTQTSGNAAQPTSEQPATVATEASHTSIAPPALPQAVLNNGELVVMV